MLKFKENKITIIVLLIILAIIVAIFYFFNQQETERVQSTEYLEIEALEDSSTFFSISENINKICEYVNNNNPTQLENIIDKDYLEQNNLTSSNIINYFQEDYQNNTFKSHDTYVISNKNLYKYYVHGYLYINMFDEPSTITKEKYFILNFDINNLSYSIEPITKETYQEALKATKFTFKEITPNEDNKFTQLNLSSYNLAVLYFNDFIQKVISNTEEAYQILDETTIEEYFPEYEDFKEYIDNHQEEIYSTRVEKYSKNNNSYRYIDNYGINYIINVSHGLNYSVKISLEEENNEEN